MRGGWALVALVLVSACSSGRLLVNGDILTMDPARPWADAVAMRDGRIVAVGTRAEVQRAAGSGFDVEDLEGRTVLPGFIDAHSHLFFTAMKRSSVDLAPPPAGRVDSLADIEAALVERMQSADLEPDEWIVATGYDDTLLEERRHPTRDDLDPVSDRHPIMLLHVSGHIAALNSRALERVGLTAESTNPPGGVIRRQPGSREPNGVLEEVAVHQALAALPRRDLDDSARAVEAALAYYASNGITTAQEAAINAPDVVEVFRRLARKDRLPIDVVGFPLYAIADQTLADGAARQYRDHFRLGGVKLMLDGSLQAYTGYLSEPYHVQPQAAVATSAATDVDASTVDQHGDDDDVVRAAGGEPVTGAGSADRGYPVVESQDTLDRWMGHAYENGWPVLAHANGDAAIDMLLRAVRTARHAHPGGDRRTVIVHAQTMREDQLDDAQTLGMIPSFFASHVYYWGDRHRDVFLGPERAARISPLRSALDRGMPFTIHHDSPVVSADMLELVWTAVTRKTSSGEELGTEQRVPAIAALRAVTINAARQLFEEETKGSIEPGKLADLVILSGNPVELDPMMIKDVVVIETIKEGTTVYRRY